MTRFIWAPTGAFLMLLMSWSFSVLLENFPKEDGDRGFAEEDAFGGVDFCWVTGAFCNIEAFDGACLAAILWRVVWHLSCCFWNLARSAWSDIWTSTNTCHRTDLASALPTTLKVKRSNQTNVSKGRAEKEGLTYTQPSPTWTTTSSVGRYFDSV